MTDEPSENSGEEAETAETPKPDGAAAPEEPEEGQETQGVPPMPAPQQPLYRLPYTVQPMAPVFEGFWPEPDHSRAPRALVAAVVCGVATALFLPLGRPGIGWPLLGLVIAVALVPVARTAEHKVHIGRMCWAGTALLLLTVCAFRAAVWLDVLCVLTACVAGMLAVSGGRSVRALGMALIAIPVAVFRAVPWSFRGMRARRRSHGGVRIGVSLAVSLVLVVIFGALFAGADERFARIVSAVVPELDAETFFRWTFLLGFFALACLGSAFTLIRPPEPSSARTPAKTLRRVEWALPVGMLVLLFAVFVVVQGIPLFGGEQHVRDTEDLTYAGYARSGFWQLALVTILTLPVIGAAARWAPKESTFDRTLLRGLGGALAVLTLVIVASALTRMWVYQHAYGFTVMRLLVHSCELWLGVVYLLVLAAGIRLRARWLPTALVGTAMAALLALALINPEGVIAEGNIARYETTGKLDRAYLTELSADALPPLQRLPAREHASLIADGAHAYHLERDWRCWNLARHLAFGGR